MFIHVYNLVCFILFQYKTEITCWINVIYIISNCITKHIKKNKAHNVKPIIFLSSRSESKVFYK